jgi:hypothetical protein
MIKVFFNKSVYMKKNIVSNGFRFIVAFTLLFLLPTIALWSQSVEINGAEVGSWFERNWMWVAGVGVLLLVLAFAGRGSNRKRTSTTVIKDDLGNVKSVTTTEVRG